MESKMYVVCPIGLIREKTLTPTERLMLMEINNLDTGNGCCVSDSYLGELFGVKPTTIANSLVSLRKKGWIRTTQFDGRNRIMKINKKKWEKLF